MNAHGFRISRELVEDERPDSAALIREIQRRAIDAMQAELNAELAEILSVPIPVADRIRRRRGWALRRYRGEHRRGSWSVAALTDAVEGQRDADLAFHRRSLRRPFNPGPVYIGSVLHNVKFFGVPAYQTPDGKATLTLFPPDDEGTTVSTLSALLGPGDAGLPPPPPTYTLEDLAAWGSFADPDDTAPIPPTWAEMRAAVMQRPADPCPLCSDGGVDHHD